MNFIIAASLLFFANVLLANECHQKALAAAEKANGQTPSTISGGVSGRGPAGISGKVEKGMLDPDGNKLTDIQAVVANGRAEAIKKATGRDLTPEQATALLSDTNAKNLLGDDFKYYLAEKAKPGGAAILKAEEEAALAKSAAEAAAIKRKAELQAKADVEEAKARAESEARRIAQKKQDEIDRQKEIEALDRRQAADAATYTGNIYKPTFARDANQMDSIAAKQSLSNYASPNATSQAERVFSGMGNAMAEMQTKITKIKNSLARAEAAEKAKGISGGVESTNLKAILKRAQQECANFASIARTAGLTGVDMQNRISDFISTYCR